MTLSQPRLTIGIPTQGKRPERLRRAIASALGQGVPCIVAISDQSKDGSVAEVLDTFKQHPLIRHRVSDATCLWENWTHAVEHCETELFAWLQDDDLIAPHFSNRAIRALDNHPKAVAWIARLGISLVHGMANWWQATGPMVPMDLLCGGTTEIPGYLPMAASFFTSFALSPGLAFRINNDTINCARRCPKDADLFVERSILAELGRFGAFVCDPAMVGYWNMHEGNESRKQIHAGEVDAQYLRLSQHIDGILSKVDDWLPVLEGWALMVGNDHMANYLSEVERFKGSSPSFDRALAMLKSHAGPAFEQEPTRPEPTTNGRKAIAARPRNANHAVKH